MKLKYYSSHLYTYLYVLDLKWHSDFDRTYIVNNLAQGGELLLTTFTPFTQKYRKV